MQSSHRLAFRDMAADTQGSLLISTDNGLYKRDPLSDNFIQIYDTVSAVETDGRNRLWIYKDNLWQLLDIHSGTCHPPLYDGSSAQRNNALLCIAGNEVYSFIGQKIYHCRYSLRIPHGMVFVGVIKDLAMIENVLEAYEVFPGKDEAVSVEVSNEKTARIDKE